MTLSIAQESKQIHEGWWEWAVWLEGPSKELDNVEFVSWLLHPTFPKPVQRVSERSAGFRLKSAGWGEFAIHAEIHLADGKTVKKSHWLKLPVDELPGASCAGSQSKPTEPAPRRLFVSSSVADATVAHRLAEELQTKGFEVTTAEDIRPGSSFQHEVSRSLQTADGAIVLVSGMVTPWMEEELAALRGRATPVLPVFIGPSARASQQLSDFKGIRLKGVSGEALGNAVKAISQRVKKMIG